MGVPKFFRYISERYPCLSEVVREYQLPEFDNLYLDMNGIIHICSHPNDTDPHFRITEEKIFRDIFHYIETLFRMIQPQRLFFMAVDGVAPRAKMNQQRGRRFRSAKEAEVAEARAMERGEVLPTVERFDSNCITPGTEFMTRLHAQLKYFVTLKVSSDKLWQKCKVILSGHEVPGEGEHKIMDYIRYMKSQPDYDPNTRHCLYGLDADLIMLGLCTHEPHFSLLREEYASINPKYETVKGHRENKLGMTHPVVDTVPVVDTFVFESDMIDKVKYGKKNNQKRIPTPEETTFFLLHLSLMREYLDLEFQQLKTTIPFPYDLESIIDDWVLMGFLVGNDFIPHLPDLHINKGALPILYKTYIEVLPTLGGYINEAGYLRLDRFQKYMEKLAAFDFEQFKETSADLRYLEAKTGRKYGHHSSKSNAEEEEELPLPKNKDLAALIASTEEMLEGSEEDDEDADSDDEDEDGTSFAEFCAHKNNYYMEKLEYDKVTPEVLRSQAEGYVRAIQWNLNYYYNGCCSWSWFYPHHYAPYISDIRNFSSLKLEYDQGQPFLPFQQLLAVLPAASKKLLPEAYHDLMENDNSPIIQFYPTEFKTDLNGKRQEWEAVVLIPFIEQESLLQAMESKEGQLTEEERSRNKHGPMQIYTYTPERLGAYVSPAYFPALVNNHAKEENVYREQLIVERSRLIKGLCPGVKLDVYFLGFPTLKHIPFTASLRKAKVKVFESPSQGDNMILTILPQGHPNVSEVASQLLGKSIYVNWPHMFEARVVAVSNEETRFSLRAEDNTVQSERMNGKQIAQWSATKTSIEDRYMDRMGIDVGPTEILVYACTLEDRKFVMSEDGKIHHEKQWSKLPIAYALQTTRTNIAVQEPAQPVNLNLEKLFLADAVVFTLDPHHYGSRATVVEVCKNHRVKVTTVAEPDVSMDPIRHNLPLISPPYMSGNEVGKKLGLSSHLVSRITGTIFILAAEQQQTENKPFKLNIGLNLKFNRRNEEVCGYTRRDKQSGYWLYSPKAEQEIREYKEKFPEVFEYLNNNSGFDDVVGNQLYPENTQERLAELGVWLKERGSCSAERQTCGAEVLDEAVVAAIEQHIDTQLASTTIDKPITFNAKPSFLYVPKPKLGQAPDPRASHRLFDRVVNVRESHTVPLGARGTIIGIHDADKGPQAMYDIVFDKPFTGGLKLRCSPHRGYRLPGQAFINRSYGVASEAARSSGKPTAVVEPTGTGEEVGRWNNNNGHSSAFASWRNKQNHDIGGSAHHNGMARQKLRAGGNADPDQHHRSPAAQRGAGGEETEHRSPRHQLHDLSLRPDLPRGRGHANPPQHQSAPNQLSSEYFAMLKQLQKAGNNANYAKPGGSVQDSSDALKKILRIADDNKNTPPPAAQPPPQIHQHQQPTKTSQPLNSCIKRLFSFHQSQGMRLPRYLYSDAKDGAIICTVVCGNGRDFKGPPAYTNEQAAENAANVALMSLAYDYHAEHGMMYMDQGLGVPKFPNGPKKHPAPTFPQNSRLSMGWAREPAQPSTLPQPPTNWYQSPGQGFRPEWQSGAGGSGAQTQGMFPVPRFPSLPGHLAPLPGHLPPPFQQAGHNMKHGMRPPFIPLQAQSRGRHQSQSMASQSQPPFSGPPHELGHHQPPAHPPVHAHQPPHKQEPAGQGRSRAEPTPSGRSSTRPRRTRLAANFSKPLTFGSPSNSQDTP